MQLEIEAFTEKKISTKLQFNISSNLNRTKKTRKPPENNYIAIYITHYKANIFAYINLKIFTL